MPESDENQTDEVVVEAEAPVAVVEDAVAPEADAKEAEAVEAAAKDAALPEWARTELSRVRGEAAKYRTSLRDAEAKLDGAKTPEEFATAVAELKAENAALAQDLARTTVGTKYKLPPELIAVLTGATPEALDAHAKLLSKFAPVDDEPGSLSGGLDPSETDGSFDPVAEMTKARASRGY